MPGASHSRPSQSGCRLMSTSLVRAFAAVAATYFDA